MKCLTLLLLTMICGTGRAQTGSIAEQYLLSALNLERSARHLAPVRLDESLRQAALLHAQEMARHGSISHRFAGEADLSTRVSSAGARFDLVTENVAEGPTAVILHDAWMHSPGHRANMLDPAVDSVGIAVVSRDGQLYAVQDFERSVQVLTLLQQEAMVGVALDHAGFEIVPDAKARETCAMTSGYSSEEQPAFVVRYTTAHLDELPSQLRKRLASGMERRASVGACNSADQGSFTSYSIAVVLYR